MECCGVGGECIGDLVGDFGEVEGGGIGDVAGNFEGVEVQALKSKETW